MPNYFRFFTNRTKAPEPTPEFLHLKRIEADQVLLRRAEVLREQAELSHRSEVVVHFLLHAIGLCEEVIKYPSNQLSAQALYLKVTCQTELKARLDEAWGRLQNRGSVDEYNHILTGYQTLADLGEQSARAALDKINQEQALKIALYKDLIQKPTSYTSFDELKQSAAQVFEDLSSTTTIPTPS